MRRRAFIAAGAWVAPAIVIAQPAQGATLSFGPSATPSAAKPTQPLAFTGDNLERDALIGAGAVLAGWGITRWAARLPDSPDPPARPS